MNVNKKIWKIMHFVEYEHYMKNIEDLAWCDRLMYESINNAVISEGLIMTHPNDLSLEIILRRFPHLTGNIEPDGEIYLEGLEHNLNVYLPIITNLGYFISKATIDGQDWTVEPKPHIRPIAIFLEPKYDFKSKTVPKFLYHATPKKYLQKILKNGLYPKSKRKIAYHPERIYLTDKISIAEEFAKGLNNRLKGQNLSEEEFVILKIDTADLSISLYRDINLMTGGYYTLNNIPPNAITLFKDSVF